MERQLQRESWDVVCFGGEETLCLAKFAEHITNNLASLTPYIVHVEGCYLKNNSRASVLGKLKKPKKGDSNVNGYIRNIRVEDIYEREGKKRKKGLSVGCSNATLEDIAADRVSFFFFGEPGKRHVLIRATHYLYYAVRPLERYTEENMNELDNANPPQYLKAIAVAKQLGSKAAKDLLIRYLELEDPDFDADMKEMTAEAFRSLEELCKRDPECSRQATDALIGYIEKNITIPAYRNSVIYAIEALGFVANHNKHQKAKVRKYLPVLLSSCNRNNFGDNPAMYWHIVWASLVTLLRTLPKKPKTALLNTAPIFTIKTSLLNDNILAEIKPEEARSVIQKALADFIIDSGIMTRDAYLLTYGLDKVDINDMQIAGERDKVTETKKLGNNLMNWITRAAPKLANAAGNLTGAMAAAILVGVVKSYFHLP